MRKQFNGIDLFKFIASIIVVAIHTSSLQNCSNGLIKNIWEIISIMAVPFFFLSTGYLSFYSEKDKGVIDKTKIKYFLKKYIKIYIIWTIVYLPITIFGFINDGNSLLKSIVLFIRAFFIIGENFDSWPLWYILSSIYAFLIIYILLNFKLNKREITICSLFILLFGCIITFFLNFQYHYVYPLELLKKILNLLLGGSGRLLYGVGYITIGINLALAEKNKKSNLKYILILILLILLVPNTIKHFILIPLITMIFNRIKDIEIKTKFINYKLLRTMSTVTYFMHMITYFLYTLIINDLNSRGFIPFIICLISTWFLGILYFYIKNKSYKKTNFIN